MKLQKLFNFLYLIFSVAIIHPYEITRIQLEEDVIAARLIVYRAVYELQIIPCQSVQEAIATNALSDMNDMASMAQKYMNNRGCFLVVKQDDMVIGMGGIKKFDDQACELTRFFFAPECRGKGMGKELMQALLQQAKTLGYTKVLLDIWNPETQINAYNFYKKFGFYEIAPYKICAGKIYMEKIL